MRRAIAIVPSLFQFLAFAAASPFLHAAVPAAWENELAKLDKIDSPSVAARRQSDWYVRSTHAPSRLSRGIHDSTLVLHNDLVRRTFLLSPNAATVGVDHLVTGQSLLRAVEPEAIVTLDGQSYPVGGLGGQPDRGYLIPSWLDRLTNAPGAFRFTGFTTGQPVAPFPWKRVRHAASLPWPPHGAALVLSFIGSTEATRDITVDVHYEIYDGLPVIGKWVTVRNGTARPVQLDRLTTERFAAVEAESAVDERPTIAWRTPAITVLSDYMFKGMDLVTGNQVARWTEDPAFTTQVSYALKTPCLLECEPPIGPGLTLPAGANFTSFRAWMIYHDSTDRERQGLVIRRTHRHLAPWSTENPIMMHVRNSDSTRFREAVDQCADVGFEMVIYTFGSGLNAESEDPAYMAGIKADVDYARAKGVEVGAYSLFSSRRIDDANDVIHPETGKTGGAIFGNAPCFGSHWGTNYFRRLTNFIARTGLTLLEHDGPYPGDYCASTNHPGHTGLADSQWAQWRMSRELYSWCRANGIYVNQPDYYFFAGGNKTAMGYREVNWSLPRSQQILHARQNIHDGTWTKPQTAGWMFVPLTEYHGGGAAATIEPLREHLPDYEAHLANTLGAGVQACWRGPRLYDSPETRDLVRKWVTWFKQYRDILESDILHVRRADGRDIDYLVHVNPGLENRAFAMIHNPLDEPVEREIVLPLHYAGLTDLARIRIEDGPFQAYPLDRQARAAVTVRIPAQGRTWVVVQAP
ncbi:MAG: alpha-galactosidase [Limisphaerales bacterium]